MQWDALYESRQKTMSVDLFWTWGVEFMKVEKETEDVFSVILRDILTDCDGILKETAWVLEEDNSPKWGILKKQMRKWDKIIDQLEDILEKAREKAKIEIR